MDYNLRLVVWLTSWPGYKRNAKGVFLRCAGSGSVIQDHSDHANESTPRVVSLVLLIVLMGDHDVTDLELLILIRSRSDPDHPEGTHSKAVPRYLSNSVS